MVQLVGLLAPDFHLDVVVHLVRGVAVAVEANIAAFSTLGINDTAFVGLNIGFVSAFAHT